MTSFFFYTYNCAFKMNSSNDVTMLIFYKQVGNIFIFLLEKVEPLFRKCS